MRTNFRGSLFHWVGFRLRFCLAGGLLFLLNVSLRLLLLPRGLLFLLLRRILSDLDYNALGLFCVAVLFFCFRLNTSRRFQGCFVGLFFSSRYNACSFGLLFGRELRGLFCTGLFLRRRIYGFRWLCVSGAPDQLPCKRAYILDIGSMRGCLLVCLCLLLSSWLCECLFTRPCWHWLRFRACACMLRKCKLAIHICVRQSVKFYAQNIFRVFGVFAAHTTMFVLS